jgi:hypothetical protein
MREETPQKMSAIGRRIWLYMQEHNPPYNRRSLAEKLKRDGVLSVTPQSISNYLRREHPSPEFVNAIVEEFELAPHEEAELHWLYFHGTSPSEEEPITAGIGSPLRREEVHPLVEPRRIRGPERRPEDKERLESLTRAAFEDAAKRRAAADPKIGRELEEVEIEPQREAEPLGLAEFFELLYKAAIFKASEESFNEMFPRRSDPRNAEPLERAEYLKRIDEVTKRQDAEKESSEATGALTADQKRLYDQFLSNLVALALEYAKKGEGLPLSDNFPPETLREDDAREREHQPERRIRPLREPKE